MTEVHPLTPIPFELLLAGRTIGAPSLSPLGDTIAFPARWGDQAGIFRIDSMGGPERLITAGVAPAIGRGAFGRLIDWAPDGRWLVFIGADGNLYRVPSSGGVPVLIADTGEGRSAGSVSLSADGEWVSAVVDFGEIWMWSVDGYRPAVRVDGGRDEFVNDPVFSPAGDRLVWQAWNPPDMAWDGAAAVIASVGRSAATPGEAEGEAAPPQIVETRSWGAIQQPRLLSDGRLICLRDDDGWLNLWIDDDPVVPEPFEHGLPTWGSGQSSYAVAPDERRVSFWRNEGGFGSLHVVDLEGGGSTQIDRGIFTHLQWRGEVLAGVRSGARTPPEIVTYAARPAGGKTSARRRVGYSGIAGWDRYELPEPELVEVGEADQIVLYARHYAVPPAVATRGLIVWVHGGPTDQTLVDWNPRIGYWWTRGYSSLVVDPQGSTGHGRAYQRALNGRWGAVDVDDTATLISYAHVRGWATPDDTIVTGSSAGGFTALGVVGRYPELVCGGIARYPVTDLEMLAHETHRFEAHYPLTLVGDFDDAEHYRRLSATSYAAEVERPLLIFHGDQDPVVPLAASIEFVDLVNGGRYDGPAQLVVLEGEGHGIKKPIHQRLEYELSAEAMQRWVTDAREATAQRAAEAERAAEERRLAGGATLSVSPGVGGRTADHESDADGAAATEADRVERERVEPDPGDPAPAEPDLAVPDPADPDLADPDHVLTDIVELDVIDPDVIEPDVIEPDFGVAEVVESDRNATGVDERDLVDPETVESETVESDLVVADVIELDRNWIDRVEPARVDSDLSPDVARDGENEESDAVPSDEIPPSPDAGISVESGDQRDRVSGVQSDAQPVITEHLDEEVSPFETVEVGTVDVETVDVETVDVETVDVDDRTVDVFADVDLGVVRDVDEPDDGDDGRNQDSLGERRRPETRNRRSTPPDEEQVTYRVLRRKKPPPDGDKPAPDAGSSDPPPEQLELDTQIDDHDA